MIRVAKLQTQLTGIYYKISSTSLTVEQYYKVLPDKDSVFCGGKLGRVTNNRVYHTKAGFIFDSVSHFSYVMTNFGLIGIEKVLRNNFFATEKTQFVKLKLIFP